MATVHIPPQCGATVVAVGQEAPRTVQATCDGPKVITVGIPGPAGRPGTDLASPEELEERLNEALTDDFVLLYQIAKL